MPSYVKLPGPSTRRTKMRELLIEHGWPSLKAFCRDNGYHYSRTMDYLRGRTFTSPYSPQGSPLPSWLNDCVELGAPRPEAGRIIRAAILARYGSIRAFTRAVGVQRKQVQRWCLGQFHQISRANRRRFRELLGIDLDRMRVEAKTAAQARSQVRIVVIVGEDVLYDVAHPLYEHNAARAQAIKFLEAGGELWKNYV